MVVRNSASFVTMINVARLLLLLLVAGPLQGQADSTRRVHRLEVGLGYGQMEHTLDITPARDEENLRGANFGLALRYFDHPLVGLQVELNYVQAGWREDLDEELEDPYERSVDYGEILLLTQLSPGRGAVQPLLQAGPYLGLPLSDSEFIPAGFEIPTTLPPSYYDVELPRRLSYGLQAGLGLTVRLGPVRLQAEGRYLIGFSNVFKTGETVAAISRRQGYGARAGLYYALFDRSERRGR